MCYAFLDDVSYKVWSCGVLAFRADGRNGGSAAREGETEDSDKCRAIGWRTIKRYLLQREFYDVLTFQISLFSTFDTLSRFISIKLFIIQHVNFDQVWEYRRNTNRLVRQDLLSDM